MVNAHPNALPLGWNEDGEPMTAPPNAVGWRVRRKLAYGPAAAVAGVIVDGVQLVLGLDASHAMLKQAVRDKPGAYLLDFVDKDGCVLDTRPAFTILGASAPSDPRLYQR